MSRHHMSIHTILHDPEPQSSLVKGSCESIQSYQATIPLSIFFYYYYYFGFSFWHTTVKIFLTFKDANVTDNLCTFMMDGAGVDLSDGAWIKISLKKCLSCICSSW